MSASASEGQTPKIADYQLIRRIGKGAYGEVWLALGLTGVFRAVKFVWKSQADGDRGQFERELRGLKRFAEISLRVPRQLAVLHVGVGENGDFFYYVMELADDIDRGREIDPANYTPCTLREISKRRGRLSPAETVAYGTALAEGLGSLHSTGLVHRDIKPGNVIVVGGAPKIADVGLVASACDQQTFVGTEGYIPPEGPGLPQADLYALGKLLYELATGRDRREFPALPEHFDLDQNRSQLLELNEIWLKACDRDLTRRYSSAKEILDDLLLLQARHSIRKMRAFESRIRRLRRAGIAAMILALAATPVAIFSYRQAEALRRANYPSQINLANLALARGNLGPAKSFLAESRRATPRHAGFEWFALRNESSGDGPRTLFGGDGAAIDSIAYSTDGGRLAALTHRRTGIILDTLSTSAPNCVSEDRIEAITWSPSDHRFYIKKEAGPDPNPAIGARWRFQSDLPVVFPKDGARFLSGFRNPSRLVVYKFSAREAAIEMRSLAIGGGDPDDYLWLYAMDQLGDRVVSKHLHGRNFNAQFDVCVSSLSTQKILWRKPVLGNIHTVAISNDGGSVAVSTTRTNNLTAFNAADGTIVWSRPAHVGELLALAFSPDGQYLASGGDDERVRIWETRSGILHCELSSGSGSIRCLAWHPSNHSLVAGTSEGAILMWQLGPDSKSTGGSHFLTGLKLDDGGGMLVSPTARWVAASGNDESLYVCAMTNIAQCFRITGAFSPLQFTSNDSIIIAHDRSDRLVWCDLALGKVIRTGERLIAGNSPSKEISSIATRGDGLVFLSATDGTQRLWDLTKEKLLWSERPSPLADSDPGFVGISPEGRQVICGYRKSGLVEVRDVLTRSLLKTWKHVAPIHATLLGPRSAWCALADDEGHISVYDLSDPTNRDKPPMVQTLRTAGTPWSLALCGGKEPRLVAGTTIGAVQFYRGDPWEPLTFFRAEGAGVASGDIVVRNLAFSADGYWLAARTSAGTLRVWDGRR